MRYALYFAPEPGSPWAEAGNSWIGRDAERGLAVGQETVPGIPPVLLSQLTSGARRYGLHATLKAPFHLAPGFSEANLEAMAAAFCQAQRRIAVPALTVKPLDHFLALRPEGAEDAELEIGALAMRCVSYFDLLRAAPADHDLATRRRRSMSLRQEALLQRWGYPYTEEEYRFHLTLSDDLREIDDDAAYALRRAAEEHFAPLIAQASFAIDRLCIFREAGPGAPFAVWRSFPFGDRLPQTSLPGVLPAPGRLFFFVGPTGAGKDSLLRWVQQRVPNRDTVFARRTVTKPAQEGDVHEAVDTATFWNLAAAGQFAMQWQVDGVSYGVRRCIEADLLAGFDVLVNGSREYVPQLQRLYPQAQVVWIEADAALLEERLAARGRESGAALLRRISRASQFPPPESRADSYANSQQVVRIDNSGEIETAGQRVLELLRR